MYALGPMGLKINFPMILPVRMYGRWGSRKFVKIHCSGTKQQNKELESPERAPRLGRDFAKDFGPLGGL